MSLDEISLTFLLDESVAQMVPSDCVSGRPLRISTSLSVNEGTPLADKLSRTGLTPRSSAHSTRSSSKYSSFDHFVELDPESPMQHHYMAKHFDKSTHIHSNLPSDWVLTDDPEDYEYIADGEEGGHSSLSDIQILVHDSSGRSVVKGMDKNQPRTPPPRVEAAAAAHTPITPLPIVKQSLPFPLSALTACINPRTLSICNKIHSPAVAVFLTLLCTLTVFPSTVVRLRSEYVCGSPAQPYSPADTSATTAIGSRLNGDLFVPVMFVLFNVSDFLGRILAGFNDFGVLPESLPRLALVRFVIVPFLLLCRLSKSSLPLFFASDLFPIFFMVVLGLSNGFLSTLAMVTFPTMVSPRKVAQAGNVMILSLNVGLLCGAIFSFLVLYINSA
jgi:hypothetical protein